MGIADKLLAVGGVAVFGALLGNLHKEAQETQRRRSTPLTFDACLSQSGFSQLVQELAMTQPRVEAASAIGVTVRIEVASISGLSSWTAEIDFNDYGRLTGTYWLSSDNSDSLVPKHFADALSTQIRSRADVLVETHNERLPERTRESETIGTTMLPPAGWCTDPYRKARLRYWNGQTWTSYIAP